MSKTVSTTPTAEQDSSCVASPQDMTSIGRGGFVVDFHHVTFSRLGGAPTRSAISTATTILINRPRTPEIRKSAKEEAMDIIDFFQTKRDRALQISDYQSYRRSLTRQLLAVRRRLGRTTSKNAKFTSKAPVTAADIANNHESIKLLLIPAERAWAHAMHIKESHAEDNTSKGISGETRRHIISKLHKAAAHAEALVELLSDRSTAKASDADYLEARAYALCLAGAAEFEKQVSKRFEEVAEQKAAWRKCLVSFSDAHLIYSSLLFAQPKEAYREVISGTVDPSIRYAAYQSKISRTTTTSTIAQQNFQRENSSLVSLLKKLNPNVLVGGGDVASQKPGAGPTPDAGLSPSSMPIPTSITWRGRTAPISDAAIGQALAATALAAERLAALFGSSSKRLTPQSLASAYDPVLISAQDTVDAVHRSIGDLSKEGVAESDARMQDLRVSDLAVNYSLISWRVGRNRVLLSSTDDDGASFEPAPPRAAKKSKKAGKSPSSAEPDENENKTPHVPKPESQPRRLSRLSERLTLLESTLQSIESITQLPGASRDSGFLASLSAQAAYFRALRCLTIGYSHQVLSSHTQALALFARAQSLVDPAASTSKESATAAQVTAELVSSSPTTTPGLVAPRGETATNGTTGAAGKARIKSLLISPESLASLQDYISLLVVRQRGLVALHSQLDPKPSSAATPTKSAQVATAPPLIDYLTTFPASGSVDLLNIVRYPPSLEPVPVKPILLDLAWNYIDYPGRGVADAVEEESAGGGASDGDVVMTDAGAGVGDAATGEKQADQQQKKRGWFGFGR